MRIGLDVRMIDYSGIGTTIRGLLDHLSKEQLQSLILFGLKGWHNPYPCDSIKTSSRVYSFSQHFGYSRSINRQKVDLFHMPHYDLPWGLRGPIVVTVHDLIHLIHPSHSNRPFSKAYSQVMMRHAVQRANRIIVVSENTKKDLVRFFPEAGSKTRVVYPAVGSNFQPLSPSESMKTLTEFNLTPGYLLYVGNLRASKNTPGLIDSYCQLREKDKSVPPLILVGKKSLPSYNSSIFPEGIRHLGEVKPEDLPALYSNASIFVFPSIYEGFGLPPLEAQACGVPVIASRLASLPEVCGMAAEYVNPYSKDELTAALRRLLDSTARRDELRRLGFENIRRFSWTRFARETWTVYEEALQKGG